MPGLFVYDGTFQGLLTVLEFLRERGWEPDGIEAGEGALQESLLSETVRVATDLERADRMTARICGEISPRALRHAFRAFLSEMRGAEYHIYRYLWLGWGVGPGLDARVDDERVHAVHRMSRFTGREAHRMRGFLRFRRLESGVYYAPMEPECDVLCLVTPHFHRRMEGQDWMIHDLAREQAALCWKGRLSFLALPGFKPQLDGEEGFHQELWRRYFRTIAVAERRNPRRQRSCMPVKYWNILVEEPSRPGSPG